MEVIAIYNEKGGVAKTTSTIGLAAAFAEAGMNVGVVDLDPQFTLTAWLDVDPKEAGLHVGAILADEEPDGWASELAVPAPWTRPSGITVVPADDKLALRERAAAVEEGVEGRLRQSFAGWDRDVILIDVPNRQGGPLLSNALTAATQVVIPTTLEQDGLEGVEKSLSNIRRFQKWAWNPGVSIAGIITTRVPPVVVPKDARRVQGELEEVAEGAGVPIIGAVTERVIVRESRGAREWWGSYVAPGDKNGAKSVSDAYAAVAAKLIPALAR